MLQNSAQQPPLRGEAGGGSVFDKLREKAWAAIKRKAENGEDGPNYLAVLIANKLTAKPQVGVDYGGQNMVKFVQDEKYSTKSLIFSDFLLTFAMSLMILLVLICSTKVSEISDMAKS